MAATQESRVPRLPSSYHRAGRTRSKSRMVDNGALNRAPSARTIARLMTIRRDDLSKSETATVVAIEGGVPLLAEAGEAIADF